MLTEKLIRGKEITSLTGDTGKPFVKGKSLIIEFVGPTGSGKTTNCHHFSELIKKQNLNVYVFSDIKEYLYKHKFYNRFQIYLKTLLVNCPDILFYAFVMACHGIYSFDSIYRYIKLCIFNSALQQFIAIRKVDVLLLDQWIIQGLWSATIFNKARSYSKLENELKRFYFKTDYVLYFDIDEETACERIKSRDSGRSRFDSMNNEKRLAELKRYNYYLYRLYENSDCKNKFKFSTKVSPDKNAEDFFHHLEYSVTRE